LDAGRGKETRSAIRLACLSLGCESSLNLLYIFHFLIWKQCIMFFGLQVDRGNLVQAVADNLLNDLNLTTNGKLIPPRHTGNHLLTTPQTTILATRSSFSRFC
jgi:hypothetical protein